MKTDINIDSTTALQIIKPYAGKEGMRVEANVVMANINLLKCNDDYSLYEVKTASLRGSDAYLSDLEEQIKLADDKVEYVQKGDPKHFFIDKTFFLNNKN